MHQNELAPFPTLVEFIRTIANAFDTKQSNKSLDEKVNDANVDYRQIEKLLVDSIGAPLQKIDEDLSQITAENIQDVIEQYVNMVHSVSLDFVSRDDSLPLLLELWFPQFAVKFLDDIHHKKGGPKPTELVSSTDLAVGVVIDWIAEYESEWKPFVNSCDKNEIDLIDSWKRGRQLPSLQRISLIGHGSNTIYPKTLDWNRVKTLLTVARAIDHFRKTESGRRAVNEVKNLCWSVNPQRNLVDELEQCQLKNSQAFEEVIRLLQEIQTAISKAIHGEDINQSELEEELQSVKNLLKHGKFRDEISYRLNFYEARWHVVRGNLDTACEHYRRAFEGSLFRGGENQERIINEALVVASSKNNPDKVLLKQLKNQAIVFGLELPSDSRRREESTYKFSDFVEQWEIDLWKSHMKHYFPCHEGALNSDKSGPVLLGDKEFNPDYRYPNRTMKLGAPRKKSMPQLIWSVLYKEVDIAKKLLDKGADVNLCSELNETAIGVAVENLYIDNNPTAVDIEMFDLLAKQEHKVETLNKRTVKKKKLPITSAVGTGRPEVVEQLLKMGADPNTRGPEDQTPLYICVYYLTTAANSKDDSTDMNSMPFTRESLNSLRGNTGGYFGFSLKQQIPAMLKLHNDPLFNEILSHWTENARKKMSVDGLHEIAKLLLDYGADPNAVQTHPLQGYTPLMYAAERDEARVFEMMLNEGGDPLKTYTNPMDGQPVNCMRIAQEFRSTRVMNLLNGKGNC